MKSSENTVFQEMYGHNAYMSIRHSATATHCNLQIWMGAEVRGIGGWGNGMAGEWEGKGMGVIGLARVGWAEGKEKKKEDSTWMWYTITSHH